MSAFRNILCPIDFSGSSRAAYDKAVELAAGWGASIMLMHVYQTPLALPTIVFAADLLKRIAQEADARLQDWKKAGEERGVSVEIMNIMGTPWERIVARAREGRHDLVVVGTHGRTGIKFALLGSVAEAVVRHASCSVLVVRGEAPEPR